MQKLLTEDRLKEIIFILFSYALLLLFYGYETGTGEHGILQVYLLKISDPSLFSNDFFFRSLQTRIINEYLFARILKFFSGHIEFFSFLGHFILSIFIIKGILKLAGVFIKNTIYRRATVLASILIIINIKIGGYSLYYNQFTPQMISSCLGIWALFALANYKIIVASLLTSAATFYSPTLGLQLFTLLLPMFLFIVFKEKKALLFDLIISLFFYLLTAGIFSYLVFYSNNYGSVGFIDNAEIFSILYYFRLPQHYLPHHFSLLGTIFLMILFPVSLFYFFKISHSLFLFITMISVGGCFYLTGLIMNSYYIINTNWPATTLWILLLGMIAMFALIEADKPVKVRKHANSTMEVIYAVSAFSIGILITTFPENIPFGNRYDISANSLSTNAEIDICRKIKFATDKNAIFVHPINLSALKYYANRASFVDFDNVPSNKNHIEEWYKRINMLYEIDYSMPERGKALIAKGNDNYNQMTFQKLSVLKERGVTHIIIHKDCPLPDLRAVVQNDTYIVYEL